MENSPPSILSDADFPEFDGKLFRVEIPDTRGSDGYNPLDAISNLRQAASEGTQAAESLLEKIAEAARVSTGASGVAVALRTKGIVVCRARSGDMGPELGTALSMDSGISGECLRTANVQICDDTDTDPRVDPEVCRMLGIRSLVAVPLRGPVVMAGILEVFSTRVAAFGALQLDTLREFAQIVESVYDRECRAAESVAAVEKALVRRPLFRKVVEEPRVAVESLSTEVFEKRSNEHRYWIFAVAAIVALLIAGVLWLGWHDPTTEMAAGDAGDAIGDPIAKTVEPAAPPKPEAGMTKQVLATRSSNSGVKNAAEIEEVSGGAGGASESSATRALPKKAEGSGSDAVAAPPAVEVAALEKPALLADLATPAATMPKLDSMISQGVKDGKLIHEVPPIYPMQARMQRIDGVVTLEATIGEDGTVRTLKAVSGPPLLVAAATDAVRRWRYSPSLLNGKPIEVQKQITVAFRLPAN